MYRTVRYLPRWSKLIHPPIASCNTCHKVAYCTIPLWKHASGPTGPENWKKWYPAANGRSQSPIPLCSDVPAKECTLKLKGYESKRIFNALNMGHVVAFQSDGAILGLPNPCHISGVHGWWEKYSFNHFHMHWGTDSTYGSEHSIDGKFYPMEVHVVHCLGNLPMNQAWNRPKGLAVLGFMYEISPYDNEAYNPIIDAVKKVTHKGQHVSLDPNTPLSLMDLLPENMEDGYFWYHGSLTTPPCTEVVHWMVFSKPITISERQMSVFRSLHRCENKSCVEPMAGNIRPLCNTNGRPVYKSFTVDFM